MNFARADLLEFDKEFVKDANVNGKICQGCRDTNAQISLIRKYMVLEADFHLGENVILLELGKFEATVPFSLNRIGVGKFKRYFKY